MVNTSENHHSELDLSVNSSEIYGKSSAIGPSPIQNCDFHLYRSIDVLYQDEVVLRQTAV